MSVFLSWKSACICSHVPVLLTLVSAACIAASRTDAPPIGDENEIRFSLSAGVRPAREHAESLRVFTGYEAKPGECGNVVLGPLPEGEYTGEEAWRALVGRVCRLDDRLDAKSGKIQTFANMHECTCSFGFPPYTPVEPRSLQVTSSPLPMLGESIPSKVVVIHRRNIEETGAASVPDLLRYVSQTAFHRGSGFRGSGAQFAELRGLGAEYTLVLVNGRRTFGTASDLTTSAFDLSAIPISAVKRVEISMDANSLLHGMDAIGGVVNLVLNDSVEGDATVRHDYLAGGGSQTHASLSGGKRGDRGRMAVYFDYQHWNELLGRERNRWSNQDFARFGGRDYRSRFAYPANVTSLNGEDLPGLGSSIAVAAVDPDTGLFDFRPREENRTSLRAFQSIVPEGYRATLWANGSLNLGRAVAKLELLASERENELQLKPATSPGYIWGPNHPENPFDVPVRVEASFSGLPASRQQYTTNSVRAVGEIAGPLGDWDYTAFVVYSNEEAEARMRNVPDEVALADGLMGDDPSEALSLYSTIRLTTFPPDLFVNPPAARYDTSATHFQGSLRGSLLELPAGQLIAHLGAEYRDERMNFDTSIRGAQRDVRSAFAHVSLPLVDPSMHVKGAYDLRLLMGARSDHYDDVGTVTKKQLGMAWRMTEALTLHVATSQSFRPPSLVDLYFPRVSMTTELFDPKRSETAPVELMTGGNPQLRPSTGRSTSLGLSFQSRSGLSSSAEYWRIRVRDHIKLLAPMTLLAHEDGALFGRIARAAPTEEDLAAGRPGRLTRVDNSRANVGGAFAEGVDLGAEIPIETQIGTFTPRVAVTLTDRFEYGDLPTATVQMENRVGVASEYGTIPAQRGVFSVTYDGRAFSASVHARVISSYRDRDYATGMPMQRRVPRSTILDLNISKAISDHLQVTLGAFNVTNREPPYAFMGGPLGFDSSQGSLEGRELYATISRKF
ncbi:TonB-dependent receptor [Steroidobacter sp. S1-65]|uniref:TonB-dependent receptor n=1 Tax=Steroidobacter gossypii TaxID=2805490 RepID=A0ABS1WZV3_9GAMM|nr:TonB-dependent receptor [Steroidobacter gossypii]MBM0106452.1 TonB-dependent receptor [Steroidobacter gossypii]